MEEKIPDPSLWIEGSMWDIEKHNEQRQARGFSDADWINFDNYIAWVIASAVQKMKTDAHTMFSFPDEPESKWEELTNVEYDIMILGFGQYAANDDPKNWQKVYDDLDAALDIFKKRFKSLWD